MMPNDKNRKSKNLLQLIKEFNIDYKNVLQVQELLNFYLLPLSDMI